MNKSIELPYEGSAFRLEFEWTDRRVKPLTLYKDGAEVRAVGHIDELDYLVNKAYGKMVMAEAVDQTDLVDVIRDIAQTEVDEWRSIDDKDRAIILMRDSE